MMDTYNRIFLQCLVAVALLFSACAVCRGAPQQSGDGGLLTLEQAVSMAVADNPDLRVATLEVEKAREKTLASKTNYYPKFNLGFLGSQQLTPINFLFKQGVFGQIDGKDVPAQDTTISTPRSPTGVLQAEVDQPLSQLYRIKLGVKALQKGEEVAAQEARLKVQDTVKKVKLAYWNVALAQSGVRSLEETVRLYREMDRVTGDYLAQEAVLKADSLQVKARLARTEYDLQCLKDSMTSAKESLNFLLGRDPLEAFSVEEAPPPAPFEDDLEGSRRKALEQRAEPAKARALLEQAELDRRAKKAEYIPDVGLSLQYTQILNYSDMLPTSMCGLGLMVKWEIYDWGRKKHELGEKDRTISQVRVGLKEATDGVVVDVNDKFRKLRQNRLLLESVRLAKETAVENLRVTADRYRQEAALVKDVLRAQADLEDANAQYQGAVISFWTAKAEFEKALGEEK